MTVGAAGAEPIFVAVASNDASAGELLASILPGGCEIIPISKLSALFSAMADIPVDVLIIDEEFNGTPFVETLHRLRRMAEDLAVLAMTRAPHPETVKKILMAGAFDILGKPLEQSEVRHKFEHALEHGRLLRKVRLMERKKQSAPSSTPPGLPSITPHAAETGGMYGPLRQFFEALAHLGDIDMMVSLVLDSLSEHFMAGKAAAVIYDEEGAKLRVKSFRGLDEELLRSVEFSLHRGIYHWLRRHHRLLLADDLPDMPAIEMFEGVEKEVKLLHAEIIMPLLGRAHPLGFISLGNKFTGEPYSLEEMRHMFFLGRHAGAAVENALLLQKTRGLAIRDELTQLFSRYYWEKALRTEVDRSKRYDRPLSVAIFDIDYFKRINDEFGHPAGDEVLRGLARFFTKSSRQTDVIGRYGGEEFIAVLPETTPELARVYCERLRQDIEQRLGAKSAEECIHPGLTVSGGITTCDRRNDSPAQIIGRADRALYIAKNGGRNRIHYLPPS